MKRLLVAVIATSVLVSPSAIADTKSKAVKNAKVAAIKCAPTKASGHAPKDVAPAQKLPKKLPRTFTFQTNCGNIVVTTVGAKAPITITQLSTLAKGGYFDNSLCHRLTTQGLYVLQCGDPTATGTGGPNFTYGDENLPTATVNNYPAGTVAMANSGAGTNGSQFFLVYADTQLGPDYTIFGRITAGLPLLKKIAEVGAYKVEADGQAYYTSDGFPIQLVVIESASAK